MKIKPVILSGGAGTRLWPSSQADRPKQFLKLVDDECSLLCQTVRRLEALDVVDLPIVVANVAHRFIVAQELSAAGQWPCDVILEPEGRNTAPALAHAAIHAMSEGEDPLLLVMPADHLIGDSAAFGQEVEQMMPAASDGHLITFGVVPQYAETGYGYIRAGESLPNTRARIVSAFVEKPDHDTAEAYCASGDYFWNSGIFLFRASMFLEELGEYAPDILHCCHESYSSSGREDAFTVLSREVFGNCRRESIDYAVMEHTRRGLVRPMNVGWSDVGSWDSLWQVSEKDQAGNAMKGHVMAVDCESCYMQSAERTIAALGVKDLVVVDTETTLLIADRQRAQDVKALAEHAPRSQPESITQRRTTHRPWGYYRSIDLQQRSQVKRITVHAGAKLSLQMHHHRAEHWIVVRGTAKVTIDNRVFVLRENESTYIPIGAKHRLENPGQISLEVIEIQTGSYLGEDDIVRFDDVYGRGTPPTEAVVNC